VPADHSGAPQDEGAKTIPGDGRESILAVSRRRHRRRSGRLREHAGRVRSRFPAGNAGGGSLAVRGLTPPPAGV
jgi:hypothetical protein